MSALRLRTIKSNERDAVLDLLKEWLHDRAFFARYFHHDPTFRDDLCFVACDGERIVSTFQIFRKQVRFDQVVLQIACVANVFTTEEYRERGVASDLLRLGIEAMRAQDFDLSLLFAVRLKFYGDLGWRSHVRHLVFIDRAESASDGPYRIDAFRDNDLAAVEAIYDGYCGCLPGTTVRGHSYWLGQLHYAGNPGEDFLVARAGGDIVAYVRGTSLYDFYVITEHGYAPGRSDALVQLIHHLHGTAGAALPGTIAQLGIEPAVQDALRARGLELRQVEDVFWMWRVVDPRGLATKLGIPEGDTLADDFFLRILPPHKSVYWMSDRF